MHTTCQCHPCQPFEHKVSCFHIFVGLVLLAEAQAGRARILTFIFMCFFVRRLWLFSILALNKLRVGEKLPCILSSMSFIGLLQLKIQCSVYYLNQERLAISEAHVRTYSEDMLLLDIFVFSQLQVCCLSKLMLTFKLLLVPTKATLPL